MSSNDEGLDKSALLLMAMGADEAAEVLKQLGPKEVQKLGAAMAAMPAQSREKLEEILDEVLLFAEGMIVDQAFVAALAAQPGNTDRNVCRCAAGTL